MNEGCPASFLCLQPLSVFSHPTLPAQEPPALKAGFLRGFSALASFCLMGRPPMPLEYFCSCKLQELSLFRIQPLSCTPTHPLRDTKDDHSMSSFMVGHSFKYVHRESGDRALKITQTGISTAAAHAFLWNQ